MVPKMVPIASLRVGSLANSFNFEPSYTSLSRTQTLSDSFLCLSTNPKSGTVTTDVAKAVKEVKAGKIEFRVDKAGILHATVGKADFESKQLVENIQAFLGTVVRLKPASAKGTYIKSISLSSTMGPGVSIDLNQVPAR